MTEYWKSNPMFWCEVCEVWLQDNPISRANHERGKRHKEKLYKKINIAQKEKRREELNKRSIAHTMQHIESQAHKCFQKDIATMSSNRDWNRENSFNKKKGYYNNDNTKLYSAIDTKNWTKCPSIPKNEKFHDTQTPLKNCEYQKDKYIESKVLPNSESFKNITNFDSSKNKIGGYSLSELCKEKFSDKINLKVKLY